MKKVSNDKEMEELKQPAWVNYWNSVAPRLSEYVKNQYVEEVDRFLTATYGYFSFCTEDLSSKATKHKSLCASTHPMIVQLHDMLRSNIHNQQHILLASAVFSLRVAFEIRANLQYVYQHRDPAMMLQRLADFATFEELLGRKNSREMILPSEVETAFATKHPYWAKGGKLDDYARWNGEGKSMKSICKELDIMDNYYSEYSVTSKFIHGSPIVRNVYKSGNSLKSIGSILQVSQYTLLGSLKCLYALEDFIKFFGIEYDPVDIAYLQTFFNHATKKLETLRSSNHLSGQ